MLMFLEMDVQAEDLCRKIIHDSFSSVMRQFAPFLISLRRSYVFLNDLCKRAVKNTPATKTHNFKSWL